MLAILTTHPIQYQVPVWQALAARNRVPFEVWFMIDHGARASLDREFGKVFSWDLEMLKGYPSRFLQSAPDATPGSFWRCRLTEDLAARLRASGARALSIQGWQVAGYWQAALAARRAGIPLWLRAESNDLKPTAPSKMLAKRILLGCLFRQVAHFLYIGAANRRLYKRFGVPDHKLQAAPYAVDNARFARQAAELLPTRSQLRRTWNIEDDAFCILFCGKFIAKKHPHDLIDAATLLLRRKAIPDPHLLFVGSGALGTSLRGRCRIVFDAEADVDSRSDDALADAAPKASFAGFLNQSEISAAYVAADCLVLPSDHGETWGLVVNEALASGLACAASRQSGCAEDLVSAKHPERLFNCGDVNGLAAAIEAIHQAASPRTACVDELGQHSIDTTVSALEALYGAATGAH